MGCVVWRIRRGYYVGFYVSAGEGRRPGSGSLMMPMTTLSMMGQGSDQGMLGNGGPMPPHHPMGNGLMNGHMGSGAMGGGPLGCMPMGSGSMGNLMGSMPMGGGMLGGGPLGSAPMMGNGYMANGGMGGLPMGMMNVDGGADGMSMGNMGGIPSGPMPQVPMPMANGRSCPLRALPMLLKVFDHFKLEEIHAVRLAYSLRGDIRVR